jgi:hypothetical protein
MSYTISIEPSRAPGKVTAHSSDGYTFTTSTPLLTGARHWLDHGADPAANIVTAWSSGTAWSLRSTIGHAAKLTVKGDHFRPYRGEPDDTSRAG